jgi:hypothetical protein
MTLSDPHSFEMEVEPHAILTIRIVNQTATEPACGRFCGMPAGARGGGNASAY